MIKSTNDIELYRNFVSKYADLDDSLIFNNSGEIHAGIVINQIYNKSRREIKILNGGFINNNSESDYTNSLLNLLVSDAKIDILINGEYQNPSGQLNLVKTFSTMYPERIRIKKTGDKANKELITSYPYHFMVGDKKRYRIEDDIKKKTAMCCFNDVELSTKLSDYFDKLFIMSDNVSEF